jgi:hypothetical protein
MWCQIIKCLPPFFLNHVPNLLTSGCNPTLKGPGPHIQPVRIVKYVNGDFLPLRIQRLLDPETPEKTRDRDESSLLSEALPATNAPSPPKSHVASLAWERAVVRGILKVT